jgi:anti-sigma regulatory factor (Ser/Thr protein kinase)
MSTAVNLALPRSPSAARAARAYVETALRIWYAPEKLIDDVALLVSEIVTNAIRHATGPQLVLSMSQERDLLHCRVVDSSAELPSPRASSAEDQAGRGLQLVAAIASRWGTEPLVDGSGKAVWFELANATDAVALDREVLRRRQAEGLVRRALRAGRAAVGEGELLTTSERG